MSEMLAHYQALIDLEGARVSAGLIFVLAFQLTVFRWVESSSLVTAIYFVGTIAAVGAPFVVAVIERPDRVFSIHDREVVWTLLSFAATIIGITLSRRSFRMAPYRRKHIVSAA